MDAIFTADFWRFVFNDLASDGYSIYFGLALAAIFVWGVIDYTFKIYAFAEEEE